MLSRLQQRATTTITSLCVCNQWTYADNCLDAVEKLLINHAVTEKNMIWKRDEQVSRYLISPGNLLQREGYSETRIFHNNVGYLLAQMISFIMIGDNFL